MTKEKEKFEVIEIVDSYTDLSERVFCIGDVWKLPVDEAEELIKLGVGVRR